MAFTPDEITQILDEFFKTVGTRQYIGARYVPIFGRKGEDGIEWDDSAPYEPLTIVLYQGNSYTSRQYVPAGVAITDESYWAQTGNYNAQVEQYRQTVLGFDSRISAVESVGTQLRNAIDEVAGALPTDDFSSSETVKDYIDSAIGSIVQAQKYMIVVGDSWSNRDTHYIDNGIGWADIVAQKMNLSLVNKAISGRGWLNGQSTNQDFLSQLISVETNNPDVNPNDVAYIIAFGGINDYNASIGFDARYNEIIEAIRAFINYANAKYPNSKIIINPMQTPSPADNRFKWCCVMNGWLSRGMATSRVARLSTVGLNALNKLNYWTEDNIHPSNGSGMSMLTSAIMNELYGGEFIEYEPNYIKLNYDETDFTTLSIQSRSWEIKNGVLYIPAQRIVFTSARAFSAGEEIKFADIGPLVPLGTTLALPTYTNASTLRRVLCTYRTNATATLVVREELIRGDHNLYVPPVAYNLHEIAQANL